MTSILCRAPPIQALVALNLACGAGIGRIVYLSVIHGDIYVDVPWFAGKHAVEGMVDAPRLNATVLRPAYFINNDGAIKEAVLGHGLYPMAVGNVGLAKADARDISEIAAID